jgi:hypothetical protein
MPIAQDAEIDPEREKAGEEAVDVRDLRSEVQRREAELRRLEKLRPDLERVDKLQAELDRLRQANRQTLQERAAVQIIDVDPKSGTLSFYEPGRPTDPRLELPDEAAVKQFLERQRREHAGRELYYHFLYPRPATGYPTNGQERRYKAWFAGVPNSLRETP